MMDYTDLLLAQAAENEKAGDWAGAEIFYRGLLKDHPAHAKANLNLGNLLLRRGAIAEGIVFLERALETDPASPETHMQLGGAYQAIGQAGRAMQTLVIAACLQGVKITPNDIQARFQLAVALNQADRHRDAVGAYRQALALQPNFAEILNNLGISLQNMLRPEEAVTAHRRAVAVAPNNAGHHCNLAHALLSAGSLAEGFAEWEWRIPSPPRDFTQPRWDGSPFTDKILLAHAEQGYGDTIQFCRYLPEAARLGGHLIVECRPPLADLIRRMPGVSDVVEWGQPLPGFDLQIPIPSLPFALRIDNHTVTSVAPTPYLAPTASHLAKWRSRLHRDDDAIKVGLVWAGNAAGHDPKRAVPVSMLAELGHISGLALYSLQREGGSAAPEEWGDGATIGNLGADIANFDDLAAAICELDLLISVDTAAAHLAGALGRPVWTLLHATPDWRWLPGPERTAWYPSMRLYRQTQPGDWHGPISRVGEDLRHLGRSGPGRENRQGR